jgi:hypothetical protein
VTATHRLCLAGSLVLGLGLSGSALAQSTDGYHSIQIFPVVVDTGSFTQRFNFRNPNDASVTITPRFFPASGTTGVAITCPDFAIAAGKTATFATLRALCPALAVGSQFGFLYTSELSSASLPYAAFSRVANPQGNGFSVEAFPAHTFTSADSVVNGLRRRAASGSNPAFQTNCFFGNLNEVTASPAPSSTQVDYTLYNSASTVIGGGTLNLAPGQYVRLLDVFASAGAAAGDYDDAQLKVVELNSNVTLGEPGLISFCTVQDNTSFGADFRIAKQEVGNGGLAFPGDSLGAQDNHVSRETLVSADGVGRNFEVATGASANTHVMYFRHPDYVQCEIVDSSNVRLLQGAGLEMRMLDQDGVVIAGGNNATGWADVFLGDKTERNNGANTRYTIEVEDNESNTGSVRAYKLHCRSGSGHTLGDLIRYKDAIGRF